MMEKEDTTRKQRTPKPTIYTECSTKNDVAAVRTVTTDDRWKEVPTPGDADIVWEAAMLKPSAGCIRIGLPVHTRTNYFPQSMHLTQKCAFSNCINRIGKMFPGEFDFVPATFNLPDELPLLESYLSGVPSSEQKKKQQARRRSPAWVVKPSGGCGGEGIFLTDDPLAAWKKTNGTSPAVVQKYLERPLLLNGTKFDLRLYVAVTSIRPLRYYVAREGLARLAVLPYEKPTKENFRKLNMHLTNYCLNKYSKDFVANTEEGEDELSSKRTVSTCFRQLVEEAEAASSTTTASTGDGVEHSFNPERAWEEIDLLVGKTLAAMTPGLLACCGDSGLLQPSSLSSSDVSGGTTEDPDAFHYSRRCFQLFGFDVIFDSEACKPHLLEVNAHPSMQLDAPVDKEVKLPILAALIQMISRTSTPKSTTEEWSSKKKQLLEAKYAGCFGCEAVETGMARRCEERYAHPCCALLDVYVANTHCGGKRQDEGLTSMRFQRMLKKAGVAPQAEGNSSPTPRLEKSNSSPGGAVVSSVSDPSSGASPHHRPKPTSTSSSTSPKAMKTQHDLDLLYRKLSHRHGVRTWQFEQFLEAALLELGDLVAPSTPQYSVDRVLAVAAALR